MRETPWPTLVLGRRVGLATVAGNAAGAYVQAAAVALGLGAVIERSIVVFTVVKILGAAYLVYLGVQAIRHRDDLLAGRVHRRIRRPAGETARTGVRF